MSIGHPVMHGNYRHLTFVEEGLEYRSAVFGRLPNLANV